MLPSKFCFRLATWGDDRNGGQCKDAEFMPGEYFFISVVIKDCNSKALWWGLLGVICSKFNRAFINQWCGHVRHGITCLQ